MPTNLGVLDTSKPAPVARAQIKRGAADSAVQVYNGVPAGTILSDGAGSDMRITYTPTYPCYWVVRGNVMTHGVDVVWSRVDFSIRISPADVDGYAIGHQLPMQVYANTTVEWRTWSGAYMFRLNPGVFYTAYLAFEYSYGWYQQYHTGPNWLRITGRVVGEGVV